MKMFGKNAYAVAAILSILVLALNFFIIKSIDEGKADEMQKKVDEIELSTANSRTMLLYMQTLENNSKLCPALEVQVQEQISRAYELYSKLQAYEKSSLLGEFQKVRKGYNIANAELWIYMKQLQKQCSTTTIPILYFYPDNQECNDCKIQAGVLDSLTKKCKNVRVFAFAKNSQNPVIQLIASEYDIIKMPSLIVKEKKLEGIKKQEEIISMQKECESA